MRCQIKNSPRMGMVVTMAACITAYAAAAQSPEVFTSIGPDMSGEFPPVGFLSARGVTINTVEIALAPERLTVELPPHGVFTARLDSFDPSGNGFTWRGVLEDDPYPLFTVALVRSHQGVVSGRFNGSGGDLPGLGFIISHLWGQLRLLEPDPCDQPPLEPYFYRLEADLGIEVTSAVPEIATFTITNSGPETAGTMALSCDRRILIRTAGVELIDRHTPRIRFSTIPGSGCQVVAKAEASVGRPPASVEYFFWVDALPPGASFTCDVAFEIEGAEPVDSQWHVRAPQDIDPVMMNNAATVRLLPLSPVPVLHTAGMLVFGSLVLMAGILLIRLRETRRSSHP